ncbi:hypothetical protein Vretifemale_15247 [Volvox reticuliferus]|uniref:Uncharacterized protein n=1 Tax=Volvox reticuliferus TaxID=1737510 RepID=A0A8J4FSH4_9CHLO|nr:hypothetical protein Vretifemale_15247 [Volvox reticuliferus]
MLQVAAGEERLQEGRDGAREHIQELFLQPVARQNMYLLDEVVVAFFTTNAFKQRRYTAQELLTCASSWGRAKHFKFVHASIPYLATIDFWEGPDVDFVVIRLPNNGFTYTRSGATEEFSRHRRGGWIELDGMLVMEFFPGLAGIIPNIFTKIVFYYNYTHECIDMQLFTDDPGATGLMLTFEPGYPYVDDRSQRQPLWRH